MPSMLNVRVPSAERIWKRCSKGSIKGVQYYNLVGHVFLSERKQERAQSFIANGCLGLQSWDDFKLFSDKAAK